MTRVFFDRELDTVAAYWRIYRQDGVALGFTTHDRDLYFAGIRHRSAPGLLPSAIRRSIDLSDDEAEVNGALDHDTIRSEDIAQGRFDGARIETGVVDWETLDTTRLYIGSIQALAREDGHFEAQLSSIKRKLDRDPVPRSSPTCRARFCGPGCNLSPARFEVRLPALSVDDATDTVEFAVEDPARFVAGRLRWLDGPYTGMEARIIDQQGQAFILDRALSEGQRPGDRALLREGCNGTISTCSARFGNAINFQGEPFLPGNDHLTQYPQAR